MELIIFFFFCLASLSLMMRQCSLETGQENFNKNKKFVRQGRTFIPKSKNMNSDQLQL